MSTGLNAARLALTAAFAASTAAIPAAVAQDVGSSEFDAVFSYSHSGLNDAEIELLAVGITRVPVDVGGLATREAALERHCPNPALGWSTAVEKALEGQIGPVLMVPPCLPAQRVGYTLDYAVDLLDIRAAYEIDTAGFDMFANGSGAVEVAQPDFSGLIGGEPAYGPKTWADIRAATDAGTVTNNAATALLNRSIGEYTSTEFADAATLSSYLREFDGFDVTTLRPEIARPRDLDLQPLFGGFGTDDGVVLYRPSGRGLAGEIVSAEPNLPFEVPNAGWIAYAGTDPGTYRIEVGEADGVERLLQELDFSAFWPRPPVPDISFPGTFMRAPDYFASIKPANPVVEFHATQAPNDANRLLGTFNSGLFWKPTTVKTTEVSLSLRAGVTPEDIGDLVRNVSFSSPEDAGIALEKNFEHYGALDSSVCGDAKQPFWNFDAEAFAAARAREIALLDNRAPDPIGIAVLDWGAPSLVSEEKLAALDFKSFPTAQGYFDPMEEAARLDSHGVAVASVAAGHGWLPGESSVYVRLFDLLQRPASPPRSKVSQRRLAQVLAESKGMEVTVMSFGLAITEHDVKPFLQDAFAGHSDQVLVLAAGNGVPAQDGSRSGTRIDLEARYPHFGPIGSGQGLNRLIVGGLQADGVLADWSDFRADGKIMLAAQACSIPSLGYDHSAKDFVDLASNGTSFAAPFVGRVAAEVAALVPSEFRDRGVRARLIATGRFFEEDREGDKVTVSVVDPTAAIAVRSLIVKLNGKEQLVGAAERPLDPLDPKDFCEVTNRVQQKINNGHSLIRVHRMEDDDSRFMLIFHDEFWGLDHLTCPLNADGEVYFDGIDAFAGLPVPVTDVREVYYPLVR